jgi:hypothetical protein
MTRSAFFLRTDVSILLKFGPALTRQSHRVVVPCSDSRYEFVTTDEVITGNSVEGILRRVAID